jgi:hypothetical protein
MPSGISTGIARAMPRHSRGIMSPPLSCLLGLNLAICVRSFAHLLKPRVTSVAVAAKRELRNNIIRNNAASYPLHLLRQCRGTAAAPLVTEETNVRANLGWAHVNGSGNEVVRVKLECWGLSFRLVAHEMKNPTAARVERHVPRARRFRVGWGKIVFFMSW